jgi:hypothetical protein
VGCVTKEDPGSVRDLKNVAEYFLTHVQVAGPKGDPTAFDQAVQAVRAWHQTLDGETGQPAQGDDNVPF